MGSVVPPNASSDFLECRFWSATPGAEGIPSYFGIGDHAPGDSQDAKTLDMRLQHLALRYNPSA